MGIYTYALYPLWLILTANPAYRAVHNFCTSQKAMTSGGLIGAHTNRGGGTQPFNFC